MSLRKAPERRGDSPPTARQMSTGFAAKCCRAIQHCKQHWKLARDEHAKLRCNVWAKERRIRQTDCQQYMRTFRQKLVTTPRNKLAQVAMKDDHRTSSAGVAGASALRHLDDSRREFTPMHSQLAHPAFGFADLCVVFFLKVRASATGGRFRGTFTVRRSPLEGDARNHRCPPRFRGMLLSPMDWFHGPLLVVLQPGPCHMAVEQDRWPFRMCTSRQGVHAPNPRNPTTQLWILLLPCLLLR